MNIIVEGYLKDFCNNFNFKNINTETQFEHFVNYTIVSNEYDSTQFNVNEVYTGENAQGIDGIAIIINNRICTSKEEVKQSIEFNKRLEVEFIFVQTKTSEKFSGTDIESFCRWTKTFFNFGSEFKTPQMKNFLDISKMVFLNSKYFKKDLPSIKLYYVCNGKWTDDENLTSIKEENQKEIENLSLFSRVQIIPCDAAKLQQLYMKINSPTECEIVFQNKVILPPIKGIDVAYSGFLPFNEFKKLIIDDNGKLKSVFEDNIRGFLGTDDNPVNESMIKTLSEKNFELFSILNNGITIVAEKIIGPGSNITITNYQIVNGCQTSNVLFISKDLDGIDKVMIPVKIIGTSDPEIRVNVTRSTNNQTKVSIEQLESLTSFQKDLELYYSAYFKKLSTEDTLYYERRKNQYKELVINPLYIIDVENQIKTFVSMFNEKPYIVSGYYSKLLKGLGSEIFNEEHQKIAYVCSSLAYVKLLKLFNDKTIDEKLWRFRYHMVMLVKYFITNEFPPRLESKKFIGYCQKNVDALLSEEKCKTIYTSVADFLISINPEIKISSRKSSEKKLTTDIILERMRQLLFDKKDR